VGETYSALGSKTTFGINPDIFGHDVAFLVQVHILGQLEYKSVIDSYGITPRILTMA